MSTILNVAAATQIPTSITAQPKPLPTEVQQGLDTIQAWIQGIGGSVAVIGLMILFIGLFFANRHGQGQDFMAKAGWWLAGAIGLGTAAVIAPVFL
ncbi:TrbC/VirB2 family protein [Nocardioides sp. NPDC051685]|uniref:Conjugal transfer protein TrbC n=1 Tax=Nocardioides albus TaxID=1841 RepID=A0A7W5A9M3_9ACTN|nr:TrbC/VirB2 family protein [Nocardioides albus]MBB3092163.1 hypothetical protein [Nocardioides albus]GGU46169.1 hypothetical protein GCM10007979_51640 [Nocardioides albus]